MDSMYYLADNPWPLVVLFLATAIMGLLVGGPRGRLVGGVALLLAVGVYLLEQQLISAGERVEITVNEMLNNFKSRDLDAIIAQIDPAKEPIANVAAQGLDMVDLSADFHINKVEVTLESEDRAIAFVRANGNVTLRQGGGGGRLPNYWKTVWIRQGEEWVLTDYTRLHPINGTEIGVFSGQ